ncbi:shikimate 5-dehydrogenase [compost metagenome]
MGLKALDPLPLPVETLAPGTVVGEVVMNPDITPLLSAAAERGCIIHKGAHMITGQIDLLVEFLFSQSGV